MVTICQKCGDKGFRVALIYCDECQIYATHRYCLDVLPATFEEYVIWLCEDCEQKVANPCTLHKPSSLLVGKSEDIETVRVKNKNNKKKKNLVRRLKRKRNNSKRNDITASLAESELQRHECRSSLQLLEVHYGQNCVKDHNLGRQKGSDGGSSTAEVESVENKSSQVAITDPSNVTEVQGPDSSSSIKLREVHCSENCEEDQKLGRQRVSDGGSSNAEAESVEFKNPQLALCEVYRSENCEEDQKLGRQRLSDGGSFNAEAESVEYKNSQLALCDPSNISEQTCYGPAQPIIEPIWRGTLSICQENFGTIGRLAAHLSSLACSKVSEAAKLLPELLCPELLPRSKVWPKGFDRWGPTDYNIALYFFPDNERYEKAFDSLVNDMMSRDLAMKTVVENAELLIFTSNILPLLSWRFQTKFYLWGVYRGKQHSRLTDHVVPAEEKDLTRALTWGMQSPNSPLSNCGSYGSSSTMYSLICPSAL